MISRAAIAGTPATGFGAGASTASRPTRRFSASASARARSSFAVAEQARHFGRVRPRPRRPGASAGDEFVPPLAAPDEQRLRRCPPTRSTSASGARSLVSEPDRRRDVLDRDQAGRRHRGPRGQEIDVVRVARIRNVGGRPSRPAAGGELGLRLVALDRAASRSSVVVGGRHERNLAQEDSIEVGHGTTSGATRRMQGLVHSTAMSRSHRGTTTRAQATTSAAPPPGRPVLP